MGVPVACKNGEVLLKTEDTRVIVTFFIEVSDDLYSEIQLKDI